MYFIGILTVLKYDDRKDIQMEKHCTRFGHKLPDSTTVCNGCGRRCDFTNSTGLDEKTKKRIAIIITIAIFALIFAVAIIKQGIIG